MAQHVRSDSLQRIRRLLATWPTHVGYLSLPLEILRISNRAKGNIDEP